MNVDMLLSENHKLIILISQDNNELLVITTLIYLNLFSEYDNGEWENEVDLA